MEKAELQKILQKASSLEKGRELALAKEFIDLDDKITTVSDQILGLEAQLEEPIEIELEII